MNIKEQLDQIIEAYNHPAGITAAGAKRSVLDWFLQNKDTTVIVYRNHVFHYRGYVCHYTPDEVKVINDDGWTNHTTLKS